MVRATIDLGCIIKKSPTAEGCWGIIVGKGETGLGANSADRSSVVAVAVVVPIPEARIEVEVVRVALVVRAERRRPVAAVLALVVVVELPVLSNILA